MKIFVDENIPLETIEALTGMGHDVLDIRGLIKKVSRMKIYGKLF
jgi:hypothetical protein